MTKFFRLILIVLAFEALFFVLLRIYMRSLRYEKLEEIWDARHPDRAGDSPARDEFVRKSMVGYEKSLKVRLAWAVFIIPNLAIMGIVYWVNWQ